MAYSCDQCDQWFDRPAKLAAHERSHSGERPFACDRRGCEKRFFRAEHLQHHEQAHDGVKTIRCTNGECSMLFRLQHHMTAHLKTHGPMPYQCDAEGCDAEFKKKNQLKKHEVSHTGVMPYPCKTEGCSKGFMLQSQLRTHSKKHTTVYTCDAEGCTHTFAKWSLLVIHRKGHRILTCLKCNKTFLRPEGLKSHETLHDPNRPQFPCTWDGCAKQYSRASNLKTHIRAAHEKNKRFKCDVGHCGAAFSHKKSLVTHASKGHTASGQPLSYNKRRSSLASMLTGIPDNSNAYLFGGKPMVTSVLPTMQTVGEDSKDNDYGQAAALQLSPPSPPPALPGSARASSLFDAPSPAVVPTPLQRLVSVDGGALSICDSIPEGQEMLPLHTLSRQMDEDEDGRAIPLAWNNVGIGPLFPPLTHPTTHHNDVLLAQSISSPKSFASAL